MPAPRRNPLLTPFFLAAVGIGLCGWSGLRYRELPSYSEADIEASTEANLAIDLARMGERLQAGNADHTRLRAQVRREVEQDIAGERASAREVLRLGLMCLVAALGSWVLLRFSYRP